jgi:hypothetical protein
MIKEGIEDVMTKRPHNSIAASPYAASSGRQASYDADGNGSPEDGEGSALKKPRSFMATLVRHFLRSRFMAEIHRHATYVVLGRHDVMKTGQNVAIAGR